MLWRLVLAPVCALALATLSPLEGSNARGDRFVLSSKGPQPGCGLCTACITPGDVDPVFSPDGKRVAFTRQLPEGPTLIMIWNRRTHRLRQLAPGQHPAWSPDGGSLAFTRAFVQPGGGSCFGSEDDLYVVRLSGSAAPIPLTNTPDISESSPSWSPGRRVTYAFAGPRRVGTGIALVRPDGSGRHVVVSAAEDDSSYVTFASPSWSTSRTRLIYAANSDLFVARSGQEPRQLTQRTETRAYLEPSWSPGDRLIAFTQWEDGIGRVYVMRSDGSRRHFIAAGREPAWTRDGASVLVVEHRATNNSDGSQSTSNCLILHKVSRQGIPSSTTRALLPAKNRPPGCP